MKYDIVSPSDQQEIDALASHIAALTVAHIQLEGDNVPLSFKYRQQALLEETIKKLQETV